MISKIIYLTKFKRWSIRLKIFSTQRVVTAPCKHLWDINECYLNIVIYEGGQPNQPHIANCFTLNNRHVIIVLFFFPRSGNQFPYKPAPVTLLHCTSTSHAQCNCRVSPEIHCTPLFCYLTLYQRFKSRGGVCHVRCSWNSSVR